jgi:hypothetical protein
MKAEDGDPLDVLVIHDAQAYPGVVLRCGPIGILELEQTSKGGQERNDRIRKAKGLGATHQTMQDLAVAKSGEGRVHMHRAAALLEHSIATLRKTRPELKRLSVAGDFRRGCELVDDFAGGGGTVAGRAGRQRGRPILGGPALGDGIGRASRRTQGSSQYAGTISCRRCRARHRRRARYLAPGHSAALEPWLARTACWPVTASQMASASAASFFSLQALHPNDPKACRNLPTEDRLFC